MRIFLSSTSYDIQDLRDLTVARLRQAGHEVVYFESPAFPVYLDEHSHDQCILSIEGCDLLICIIDRRYGGKYRGRLGDRFPDQKIKIRHGASGKKREVIIKTADLSATWCEVLEARRLKIRVMTFARQGIMDEKETRRENWHIKAFRTAFAEDPRVFDFLDWTTQQDTGNWIVQYRSIAEFEDKLMKWVESYAATYVSAHPIGGAAASPPIPTATVMTQKLGRPATTVPIEVPSPGEGTAPSVCVLCEGSTDVFIVKQIVEQLELPVPVRFIAMHGGGKSVFAALPGLVESLLVQYERFVILVDSDTWDEAEIAAKTKRIEAGAAAVGTGKVSIIQAVPSIESWVIAGIDPAALNEMRARRAAERELKEWVRKTRISGQSAFPSLRGWNIASARNASQDLDAFISALLRASEK